MHMCIVHFPRGLVKHKRKLAWLFSVSGRALPKAGVSCSAKLDTFQEYETKAATDGNWRLELLYTCIVFGRLVGILCNYDFNIVP